MNHAKSEVMRMTKKKYIDLEKIDFLWGFKEVYQWMTNPESAPKEALTDKPKEWKPPLFTFGDVYAEMIEKAKEKDKSNNRG